MFVYDEQDRSEKRNKTSMGNSIYSHRNRTQMIDNELQQVVPVRCKISRMVKIRLT
jgi:hypothetical protein